VGAFGWLDTTGALDTAGALMGASACAFGLLGASRGPDAAGGSALAGGGTGAGLVVVVVGAEVTVVVVVAALGGAIVGEVTVGAEVTVVEGTADVDGAEVEGPEVDGPDVDGAVDPSGGGANSTSEGTEVTDVSVGADVTGDPEVVVSDVVVASTTGTGSQVKGEEGSTGSGCPGGSVAAGFCSTTLYVNAFHCSTRFCLLSI
jgi:hypothetical protein